MSKSSAAERLCTACGRAVGTAIIVNGLPFHSECARGRDNRWWHPNYEPNPLDHEGARPLQILTETDVRRIVREELAIARTGQAG